MTNLSNALQPYYTREKNRVVFNNGQSLNQLALAMWECLDFQQVDASVISRVIKGDRLFTVPQLEVFCSLLNIAENKKVYLFSCLQQDRDVKFNLSVGTTRISSSLLQEVIQNLTVNAFGMFYGGNYSALDQQYDLVLQLTDVHNLESKNDRAIQEAIGLNLYLKARTVNTSVLPNKALGAVYPIYRQLLDMSKKTQSRLLYGYACAILSDSYYIAGGYSNASTKHRFYKSSIRFAEKALCNISDDDHERLLVLRIMAASASYIGDKDTLAHVLEDAKETLPKQPAANYINAHHLSAVLGRSVAVLGISSVNPFLLQENAVNYFDKDLKNTGIYEVSVIKEEIMMLVALGTGDKNYISSRAKRGLLLATRYELSRHREYFTKFLNTL